MLNAIRGRAVFVWTDGGGSLAITINEKPEKVKRFPFYETGEEKKTWAKHYHNQM